MEKTKVLLSVGAFPPDHSGSGLRLKKQYKRLQQYKNIDVTVFTLSGRSCPPGYSEDGPFKIHRFPFGRVKLLFKFWFTAFKFYFKNFDYAHIAGRTRIDILTGVLCYFTGIPFVFEMTAAYFEGIEKNNARLKSKLIKRVIKNADLCIALNDEIKDYFLSLEIDCDQIWVRPTPINAKRFKPVGGNKRLELRKEKEIPTKKIIHSVIGRIRDGKNPKFALEVVKHLPEDHYLFIAGPLFEEDNSYHQEMIQFIKEKELTNRVKILPEFVGDVEKYYQSSDALWCPSKREGTPNVMLEALACGIPVFVNEKLGLEEFFEDKINGLRLPLKPEEFARKILNNYTFPEEHKVRKKRSENILKKHSAEKVDTEFIKKINNLIA